MSIPQNKRSHLIVHQPMGIVSYTLECGYIMCLLKFSPLPIFVQVGICNNYPEEGTQFGPQCVSSGFFLEGRAMRFLILVYVFAFQFSAMNSLSCFMEEKRR